MDLRAKERRISENKISQFETQEVKHTPLKKPYKKNSIKIRFLLRKKLNIFRLTSAPEQKLTAYVSSCSGAEDEKS